VKVHNSGLLELVVESIDVLEFIPWYGAFL
jgi:hypothetical protein